MSKITVTTIAGLTSGGDANTVKIESGDTLAVQTNATVGGTLGVTGASTLTGNVGVNGGTGGQVAVNYSTASTTGLKLNDTNSGNLGGFIDFRSGSGAGTQRATIQNANNTGIHVNVGTGGSVCFTNVGYTSANALDDYEEGSFTPTLFGSTTGTGSTGSATGTGNYRKVGSICTIQVYFSSVTLSSQSGQLSFGALPFTSIGAYGVGAPMMYGVDFPANSYVVGYISGTSVGMYSVTDNAAWGQIAVENQSGLYLTHALTYITT